MDVEQWLTRVNAGQASTDGVVAALERAQTKYKSEINGINTTVANMEAQLKQALYYLDNTTLTAPEDGRIINLQVRPSMVSGIYRVGGIAALIADADRYLLATYFQENLKYVKPGQPVEVSLDLYPGQIFAGKVDNIWRGNGVGQYLPTDEIPKFHPSNPDIPQSQYAVKILFDDPDQSKFSIGAQGSTAIYTGGEHGQLALSTQLLTNAEGMQYGHGHLFTPSHKLMAPCDLNGQIATTNANLSRRRTCRGEMPGPKSNTNAR